MRANRRVAQLAEELTQVGHRHALRASDIDPAQECDIPGHTGTLPVIAVRSLDPRSEGAVVAISARSLRVVVVRFLL
jgi:hypothetical protein